MRTFATPHRQCLQDRNASMQSSQHAGLAQAYTSRPFGDMKAFAVKFEVAILSGIAQLLQACGPLTVISGIALVVIDAFKRKSLRLWSHILTEVVEQFPSIAHCNASTTVTLEVLVVWHEAARHHLFPYSIFGSASAVRRGAAMLLWSAYDFVQAAASLGVAFSQTTRSHTHDVSTRTLTLPEIAAGRFCGQFLKRRQSMEHQPCEVFGRRHGLNFTLSLQVAV